MFIQETEFEAIVTVNVTTLLTLATLFMSISNSLPRTSYVKMIDIWLIINLMIPFLEIILTTLNTYFNEDKTDVKAIIRVSPVKEGNTDEDEDTAKSENAEKIREQQQKTSRLSRVNRFMSRCGLPGLYVLFCVAFFLYGTFAV